MYRAARPEGSLQYPRRLPTSFIRANTKLTTHLLNPGVLALAGVLNVIHGDKEAVDFVCDAPDVKAISFVGGNQVGWCWSCCRLAKEDVALARALVGLKVQLRGGTKMFFCGRLLGSNDSNNGNNDSNNNQRKE